ncbi:hypothetical protein A2686_05060 [Candidatus Woesebacteria bacterium RIFCSPHIGHO2_01_FULL_38_10]|uniref:DUF7689 domain-containing protein n=1 Tax=Candidatus Woesebacteria bacterium RIFCSPLOWO2_01_FULL_39_10b TaxID=1802517 RepID=A0A1F8B627_9BACT|nr:MAG: hypothetical protein A2686_05060 [Candidatus Woesebacteria bacterium RIFCSPHIGHO2_01_FULL_38_10]OGM59493.1 MAG: hypothetical protein A2892_02500 [Candidatus Woesebacteria bacterium RIFCSPLOWO2_01_FULL_39_10b]
MKPILIYEGKPSWQIRERLSLLCSDRDEYPTDDSEKFRDVFFPEFSNILEVIEPPPGSFIQYNCYAHVLGLKGVIFKEVVVAVIEEFKQEPTDSPKTGDIVIYRNTQMGNKLYTTIEHAGILSESKKVISKWGEGALFKHDIFYVPLSYGNVVEFYKPDIKELASEIIKKRKTMGLEVEETPKYILRQQLYEVHTKKNQS